LIEFLDSTDNIRSVDVSDMCGLLSSFPKQCMEGLEIGERFCETDEWKRFSEDIGRISNVVVAGMGGSAIGGDVVRSLFLDNSEIPIFVNRDYHVPSFVGKDTLFIAVSYSGNTEETISSAIQAMERKAKLLAISSGGKLERLAKEMGFPSIRIPGGRPPRCSIGYLLLPTILILSKVGIGSAISREDILSAISHLEGLSRRIGPESPYEANISKQLANRMFGKIPLIYASQRMEAVAIRWRTQINENGKMIAMHHVFPEMNHNEIVGWEEIGSFGKLIHVVLIRDEEDGERISARMDVTLSLIREKSGGIDEVRTEGEGRLSRMLHAIYIGDFTSFYLAVLRRVDPTPVKTIDLLKKELAERIPATYYGKEVIEG
jgi:glucose/mannose-6-phosphate isomerase